MTTTPPSGPIRVKVGSLALLTAAGTGYGIGLDDDGHRWQLIAVDDELRVDLSRDAMAERGAFVRSAMAGMEAPE